MKIAIISDIHGNYKALEAFLAFIKFDQIDGIICLGDYITDSPYPERTLKLIYEMMKEYQCYMIRGNREEYLLRHEKHPQGWKPSSSNGALYYTYQHITKEDLRFFDQLPITREVFIGNCPKLTLCHGAPEEIRGNFEFDLELKDQVMKKLATQYLLGGHSHHQERCELHGKVYINPGSLGLAIDGRGKRAEFAIMQGSEEEWKVKFYSIEYDIHEFLRDFRKSGLDEYGMVLNKAIKKTLLTGENYFYHAVCEACKLSEKPLHEIEENIWLQVEKNLDL